MTAPTVAVVLIGRNEGDRLVAALAALPDSIDRAVYVDSGSTDGSVEAAHAAGVEVLSLDMSRPFSAARARNFGANHLLTTGQRPTFVQFIDGDCILQTGWLDAALAAMERDPKLAVVCGRRRERFPEASVYNWLIDREWNTPVGPAKACGGDALIRLNAFEEVDGFTPDMIAGEEPEMCLRLRRAGWKIERLDAEMTLHDAALDRFAQWWKRARRAGHAYAEGAFRHGKSPDRHKVPETIRAVSWGIGLPCLVVLGTLVVGPVALMGLLIWPLQVVRLRVKGRPWAEALFMTIGKFPEALGVLEFHARRLTGGGHRLIEYK